MPEPRQSDAAIVEFLRIGKSYRWIAAAFDVTERQIEDIAAANGLDVSEALTSTCEHESCGKRQTGAGRPRQGWINVRRTGEPGKGVWCCSWLCVAALARRRLAPRQAVT